MAGVRVEDDQRIGAGRGGTARALEREDPGVGLLPRARRRPDDPLIAAEDRRVLPAHEREALHPRERRAARVVASLPEVLTVGRVVAARELLLVAVVQARDALLGEDER